LLSDAIPARSAVADTAHISRIESELTEIKSMLNDYGIKNANRKEKLSELLNDDDLADENISNNNSQLDFIKQ